MNDELEGLIDKQLDKMNYIPELEPKDYMVIVGFEKLHVTKIIKNRKGNVPDLTDEDMDKFLQKFTNLTFKVNASSVQEAISRVTVTTANMAYLDAIAKGFDLLAQLYSDLDTGNVPDGIGEKLGFDANISDMERLYQCVANLTMTNMDMYLDVADSSDKGSKNISKMKMPEITSIIAFEEGKHTTMFAMSAQEMTDIADKVSKAIEEMEKENDKGDE
jgi:hypothetical protein|tara:strand:+ start:2441 stop:3094 length:654 start_codon:yes stop_codon:yes gene_type:complete